MTQFVHEFPGPSTRFDRLVGVDEPARIVELIAGVFSILEPVMVPLVVAVELGVFEPSIGLLQPDQAPGDHKRAIATQLPQGVHARVPARPLMVEGLRPAVLGQWLEEQLGGDRGCVSIVELTTPASEAHARGLAEAEIRARAGITVVPSRRDGEDVWLAGPVAQAPGQPPIRVTIQHDLNQLHLAIGVEWSWWSEGPGRADLERITGVLVDAGWTRRSP